jgi:monothiol glutaredoxin
MTDINNKINELIKSNDVVLFMKGSKSFPMCGFSATVAKILNDLNVQFTDVDILKDEELRQAIKQYSDWPTIPQLYIKGEFIGGCDIIKDSYETGELQTLLAA